MSTAAHLKPTSRFLLIWVTRISIAGLMIAGLFGYGEDSWFSWDPDWIWRLTYLGAATVLMLSYTKLKLIVPFSREARRPGSWDVDRRRTLRGAIKEAARAQESVNHTPAFTRNSQFFALAILEPSAVRQRVVEECEPQGRTIHQRVLVEASLPARDAGRAATSSPIPVHKIAILRLADAVRRIGGRADRSSRREQSVESSDEPEIVPFPVLIPPKGELFDNLQVLGVDGKTIPIIARSEYLELVAVVLRGLLATALGLPPNLLPANVRRIERHALIAIAYPWHDSGLSTRITAKIGALNVPIHGKPAHRLAIALVRLLSANYAIVASVPIDPSGRLRLMYDHTFVLESEQSSVSAGLWERTKDMLRVFLGARRLAFRLDLEEAEHCQSYHLRVAGPAGTYLGSQRFIGFKGSGVEMHYGQYRPRRGQAHSHVYFRNLRNPQKKDLDVYFEYYEVPPGSVFRAAVAAVASFALIVIVAVLSSRKNSADFNAAAFLLTFPAFAAAWLGKNKNGGLLEGTLWGKMSLIVTICLSVATSTLFVARGTTTCNAANWPCLPRGLSFLGIYDLTWAVAAVLGLLHASAICYITIVRTWQYWHLSSGTDRS